MLADEVRLGQAGRETVADEMDRRADLTGTGDDDRFGFGRHITDDAGHARLEDAGLLSGDGGERRAKVFLVVESDGRDHADFRRTDIRGVKAAAEARLENRDVDLPFRKFQQRRGGDQLEESRGVFRVFGADGLVVRAQAFGEGDHRGVGQRDAVDLEAFADGDEMRAGVEAGAAALRALDRFNHRGGRALAVGAGDMEAGLRLFRMTDAGGEKAHAVHAEARTEVT